MWLGTTAVRAMRALTAMLLAAAVLPSGGVSRPSVAPVDRTFRAAASTLSASAGPIVTVSPKRPLERIRPRRVVLSHEAASRPASERPAPGSAAATDVPVRGRTTLEPAVTEFAGLQYDYTILDEATSTVVRGRLLAKSGEARVPVSGADVVVRRFFEGVQVATSTVVTDEDGAFGFVGERGHLYQVNYFGDPAHAPQCMSIGVWHMFSVRSTLTVTQDASGTATLTAAVEDRAHTPVAYVKLTVERQSETGEWTHCVYRFTDASGEAVLSGLLPGEYRAILTDGATPLAGRGTWYVWGTTTEFSVGAGADASPGEP